MIFRAAILLILLESAVHGQGRPHLKNADIENIGNRDINRGRTNLLSYEKEIALGMSLATEFESRSQVLDDPVALDYIRRVGQTIAVNSDVKIPCTFNVVNSDEINAVAIAGGFIYVNAGLIRAADSQAELASVLAHLVAHVAARHGTATLSKATLLNVATIDPAFPGYALNEFVASGVTLRGPSFSSFVRAAAMESDYLGVQYLYKSGYDPEAALTFLEKFDDKKRFDSLRKAVQQVLPVPAISLVDTSEFRRVKERLVK